MLIPQEIILDAPGWSESKEPMSICFSEEFGKCFNSQLDLDTSLYRYIDIVLISYDCDQFQENYLLIHQLASRS